MVAGEATVATMTLAAKLPTLLIGAVGSGSSSGGEGDAVIQDQSRFSDYILRHSRF
jgi:hypothetical protein